MNQTLPPHGAAQQNQPASSNVGASRDIEPAHRRHGPIAKPVSYLSAAWCGISLLALGAVITAILTDSLRKAGDSGASGPWFLANQLLLAGFSCWFSLALGVASARFLLRAFPPAMSNTHHSWLARIAIYATYIGLYALFLCAFLLILSVLPLGTAAAPADTALQDNLALGIRFAMFWIWGAVGLLIRRNRAPRAFLDQPFVLFLRRFSTFSDRAVVALILRQAAYDVPIVFLTPTWSRSGDWDPYLVGFAGLKPLHPVRSAPIVVRARDDAWHEAAKELIERAVVILLDTSETSSAMRAEFQMLDETGRWPDTVCLTDTVTGAQIAHDGRLGDVRTIKYTKSWMRAVPKMAIGLLLVGFALVFLALMVGLLLSSFSLRVIVTAPLATAVLLSAGAYYYSVFVLPTIDREAKIALKKVLRAVRPGDATPRGIGGWLAPPFIFLAMVPIAGCALLLTQYWPLLREGAWQLLITPGSVAYQNGWAALFVFKTVGVLIDTILAAAALVLFWRESKRAPGFVIAALLFNLAFRVSYYWLFGIMPLHGQQSTLFGYDMISIAFAAIWIPYFMFSRRVKATFVR